MAEVPMLSAESKARVEAVLGRAASDTEFRQMLTSNPAAALEDTNLTAEEREMLASMKRVALEEWGVEVRTFRNFILDDGFDDLDDAPGQI